MRVATPFLLDRLVFHLLVARAAVSISRLGRFILPTSRTIGPRCPRRLLNNSAGAPRGKGGTGYTAWLIEALIQAWPVAESRLCVPNWACIDRASYH